jgi:hypothetical protein
MKLVCGNLFLPSPLAKQSMGRRAQPAATAFTGKLAADTSWWPCRPNGAFAGASTVINATSHDTRAPRPRLGQSIFGHRSPVWIRRPVPSPGRRTSPAMATPTRASGK